jgi:hypothetical protein
MTVLNVTDVALTSATYWSDTLMVPVALNVGVLDLSWTGKENDSHILVAELPTPLVEHPTAPR